jgi:hypothetical protein
MDRAEEKRIVSGKISKEGEEKRRANEAYVESVLECDSHERLPLQYDMPPSELSIVLLLPVILDLSIVCVLSVVIEIGSLLLILTLDLLCLQTLVVLLVLIILISQHELLLPSPLFSPSIAGCDRSLPLARLPLSFTRKTRLPTRQSTFRLDTSAANDALAARSLLVVCGELGGELDRGGAEEAERLGSEWGGAFGSAAA